MEKKIVSCSIVERKFDNRINVTYEDGSTEGIYFYYPDELRFTEDEFVGLTRDEAKQLCHQKDLDYLRGCK